MRWQTPGTKRQGAHLVECALVYPIAFFVILATLIGGLGIFNYQETAFLAREAARYASTHGGQYAQQNAAAITAGTLPIVNESYLTNSIIYPKVSLLDTSQLTVTTYFNSSDNPYPTTWDTALANGTNWPSTQASINGTTYSETNMVSITISYAWYPLGYLAGPITLQSTSIMPMCY